MKDHCKEYNSRIQMQSQQLKKYLKVELMN